MHKYPTLDVAFIPKRKGDATLELNQIAIIVIEDDLIFVGKWKSELQTGKAFDSFHLSYP